MDYKTGNVDLDKELDDRFGILSPTVRQLISGDSLPNFAHGLALRFSLDDEMEAGIANEIMLVLMYLEPVEEFAGTLMSEYLIPPEIAFAVEKETSTQFFTPLKTELGSIKDLSPEESGVSSSSEPVSTPITTIPVSSFSTSAPQAVSLQQVETTLTQPQNIPTSRVMPRSEVELPGTLLQNLKSSLAHDVAELPYTDTPTPKASYGAILDNGTKKE